MNKDFGFGLSEVLISLFLTSLTIVMLVQFYLSNKGQYQSTESSLDEFMDVQWVTELVSDSIKKAGFSPCMNIERLAVVDRRVASSNTRAIKIDSAHDQGIHVSRMSELFEEVLKITSPFELSVSKRHIIDVHHPLLIADCQYAEIHELERVERGRKGYRIFLKNPLINAFEKAYVGRWVEEHWFIKPNRQGIKTLHYRAGHVEELSPHIHSLNAEFREHNKHLVDVVLGIDNNQSQQFSVLIRGL